MEILDNYDEAADILLLPIVNNKNESSELAHEIEYWEAVGSLYIRQGEEKYGFENTGSITMYNPDSNIRRIPTSYERDYLEELLKKPDGRKKENKQ